MKKHYFAFRKRRKPAEHIRKKRKESGKKVALYQGRIFWSGSVRLSDGSIQEVHSFHEAQEADFYSELYFSSEQASKMENGECGFFWVEENGKIETDWESFTSIDVVAEIKKQITVIREKRIKKAGSGMGTNKKRRKAKVLFPRGGKQKLVAKRRVR